MPLTLDGHYIHVTPGRIAALICAARRRGAAALLGVPVDGRDEAVMRAVGARVARILAGSRLVDVVEGAHPRGLFETRSAPPFRAITLRSGARSWILQWIARDPRRLPSAREVNELEVHELQYNIGPLDVDLDWSPKPVPWASLPKDRGDIREGAVYIQVNPQTGAPIKVGKTDDLRGRMNDYGKGTQFWTGTIRGDKISTIGGGLGTIEKALSRQLISAGGLKDTDAHDTPREPQKIVGDITIKHALPLPVKKRYRRLDKKRNTIRWKKGSTHELEGRESVRW